MKKGNMNMKALHMIAYALIIIGALNWGLVGLFNLNLVNALFGTAPLIEKLVYVLIGVAALAELVQHKNICKYCSMKK